MRLSLKTNAMKKPILLFALKCFAIVYITAFTNIDKFSIAPSAKTETNNDKAVTAAPKANFVSIQNDIPSTDNLYVTHL
jgi:hypothetical protein